MKVKKMGNGRINVNEGKQKRGNWRRNVKEGKENGKWENKCKGRLKKRE